MTTLKWFSILELKGAVEKDEINGGLFSDPYVKVYNMYQNKRVQKVKTSCKSHTLDPEFEEKFTFTVPTNKLDDTLIVVTVMDKDILKWNEKIGM